MHKHILVFNSGSSSLKFSVFVPSDSDPLLKFTGEFNLTSAGWEFKSDYLKNSASVRNSDKSTDYGSLAEKAFESCREYFGNEFNLIGVGHRVVHGGIVFSEPTLIDDQVISQIEELIPLAPLHQPINLAPIKFISRNYPQIRQIACFDTSFHMTQNPLARIIAVARKIKTPELMNFGFHGLSYEYIAGVIKNYPEIAGQRRVVVAHLGSGASICAIKGGQAVATTMGFTALNGLVMATRPGSIDPGAVFYLQEKFNLSPQELSKLFYKESGLLAVSGKTGNMRELLDSDDPDCQLAVNLFVYRVLREIGSLSAAIEGIDALVFTGGIGENSAPIREKVCQKLGWLGIELDAEANKKRVQQGDYLEVSAKTSKVRVVVIPTDENLVIARAVVNFAG